MVLQPSRTWKEFFYPYRHGDAIAIPQTVLCSTLATVTRQPLPRSNFGREPYARKQAGQYIRNNVTQIGLILLGVVFWTERLPQVTPQGSVGYLSAICSVCGCGISSDGCAARIDGVQRRNLAKSSIVCNIWTTHCTSR